MDKLNTTTKTEEVLNNLASELCKFLDRIEIMLDEVEDDLNMIYDDIDELAEDIESDTLTIEKDSEELQNYTITYNINLTVNCDE